MTSVTPYLQVDANNPKKVWYGDKTKSVTLNIACTRCVGLENGVMLLFDGGTQGYILRFDPGNLNELRTQEPITIYQMPTLAS